MSTRLLDVPTAAIQLTAANPRTDGADDLRGLSQSLAHGYAQCPTLTEIAPGVYEVLTGERRVRAGIAAGLTHIPALIEAPLDAVDTHTRRLLENLHRRDLGPLDEARALKLGWLLANADALSLRNEVAAALHAAGSVAAGLSAVQTLLDAAGWSGNRPAVTQDAYLDTLGLALSKAALRKKLQVLNLDEAVQQQAQQAGLTAAAVRAVMRLPSDDQRQLMQAVAVNPTLAKDTRTIVEGVTKKGRSIGDAISIAQGQVPGAAHAEAPATAPTAGETHVSRSHVADDQAAMDAVLPLVEFAQQFQTQCAAVQTLLAGHGLDTLPEPWGDFATDALGLIRDALNTLSTS